MKLTPEQIEELATKALENFGAPEYLVFVDPDTNKIVTIDIKNPSDEAIIILKKIFEKTFEK